jgi:hypothetical protein
MVRPADTSPDAWRAHVEAIRRMDGSARVAKALELGDAARSVSEAGIRHRHPDWTDQQVRDALVDLRLGEELARAVRRSRLTPA